MGMLARSDQVAGTLARAAATFGQMALVCLGVHLAADQLDDRVLGLLDAWQGLMDGWLAEPLGALARRVGWQHDALCFWADLPLTALAAWFALGVELTTTALLCGSFLLTTRQPELRWKSWRQALSVRAVVLPLALAGVTLAGSWSLAMATEDVLPASPVAPWAAGAVGLAALARFGTTAWARAVGALDRPRRRTEGLGAALVLAPMGLLAWMHGLPVWGWLP